MSPPNVDTLTVSASWRDYWTLTKPRVVALIMLTALVGSLLAAPGHAAARCPDFRQSRHRARRRIGGRGQSRARCAHRRTHGAHAPPPAALGSSFSPPGAAVCTGARRGLDDPAGRIREPADRRPDLCIAHRLCRGLHRVAEARDAAEHRHRRRRRRRSTGTRLGRGHQPCRRAGAAAVHDHLHLDSAALLGTRDRATGTITCAPASPCSRSRTASSSRACTCCSIR